MTEELNDQRALIRAAKYICTENCGKCPMYIENFPCPKECGLDTVPWECWLEFFKSVGTEAGQPA